MTGVVKESFGCGCEVRIENARTIVPPYLAWKNGMMHLLRHPDGSLYINAHAMGLYRSSDNGQSWSSLALEFPDAGPNQDPGGFGISRDGRLWAVHQSLHGRAEEHKNWKDLFVSSSADCGRTWQTTAIDWANLAPGAPDDPYTLVSCAEAYTNFIERPDGTLIFSLDLRYDDWRDYQQENQSRPGIRNVMIRSTDGGESWGDPTLVHQHTAETDFAVNPADPDHVLAITRKQRMLLRGENRAAVEKESGCPIPGAPWPWKGSILLESKDGGRSFHEVLEGLVGFGQHRGAILWTERNVVIVTHQGTGGPDLPGNFAYARISVDGGKTWLDDTKAGTPAIGRSKKFMLGSEHSQTAPTVEISPNRFLTVHCLRVNPLPMIKVKECPAGEWFKAEMTFKVPARAAKARFDIEVAHQPEGEELMIDDVFSCVLPEDWRENDPIPSGAENQLKNASFEEVDVETGFAAGWHTASRGSGTLGLTDRDAHSGKTSVIVSGVDGICARQDIAVQEGQHLCWSIWLKSSKPDPEAIIQVSPGFYDRHGEGSGGYDDSVVEGVFWRIAQP